MVSLLRGLVSDVMHGVSGSNSNSNRPVLRWPQLQRQRPILRWPQLQRQRPVLRPPTTPPTRRPRGQYYPQPLPATISPTAAAAAVGTSRARRSRPPLLRMPPTPPAAIPASGHRLRHARRAMKHALKAQRRAGGLGTAYYYDAPAPAPALIPVRPVPWTSSRAVMRMPAAGVVIAGGWRRWSLSRGGCRRLAWKTSWKRGAAGVCAWELGGEEESSVLDQGMYRSG